MDGKIIVLVYHSFFASRLNSCTDLKKNNHGDTLIIVKRQGLILIAIADIHASVGG